jgi:hypothetical protein
MKHLEIKLMKEVEHLDTESYKTLMKVISEATNK